MQSRGHIPGLPIAVVLFTLSFILRIWGIAKESLWFDEAFSVYHAQHSIAHIWALQDPTPPLHLLILHATVNIAGSSELAVRMLSALLGALSVVLTYFLARKLSGSRAALFSGLLLALSPFHIFYSQEARTYTLFVFLSLVSVFSYIHYRENPSRKSGALFVISSALLIYSHIFGFLQLFAYFLHFWFDRRGQSIRTWLFLNVAVGILFLPWLGTFLYLASQVQGGFWISRSIAVFELIHLPAVFAGGAIAAIVLWGLAFVGARNAHRQDPNQFRLIGLWLVVPIVMALLVSLWIPIFLNRYLICSLIPFIILAGAGLASMRRLPACALVGVVLLLCIAEVTDQVNRNDKFDWRSIGIYAQGAPSLSAITPGHYALPYAYYANPLCFAESDLYACLRSNAVFPAWSAPDVPPDVTRIIEVRTPDFISLNHSLSIAAGYLRYTPGMVVIFDKEPTALLISLEEFTE